LTHSMAPRLWWNSKWVPPITVFGELNHLDLLKDRRNA
jgi:hypothetical protein